MAKEAKVVEALRKFGVEPLEDSCIVVQYAAPNLSEKVARYLGKMEPYYVLQVCEKDLVLAPLSMMGRVKDDILTIGIDTIKSVAVKEEGFNYRISIKLEDGELDLIAQQKELSLLRNSGALSTEDFWGSKSWHVDNLDGTLKKLKSLVRK